MLDSLHSREEKNTKDPNERRGLLHTKASSVCFPPYLLACLPSPSLVIKKLISPAMEQFQGGAAYQVYSPQGSKPLDSLKIVGPVRKEYDKLSKSQVIVVEQPTSRITVPKVLTGALLVHPVIVVQIFALNITAINIEFCVCDALGKRRLIFSNSFTTIQAHPQHTKFPFQLMPRNVWMDVVFDIRSIHRTVYETRAPVGFRGVESVSLSGAGCKVRRIYSLREAPSSFLSHNAPYHLDIPAQFALPGDVEQQHVLVQHGDELLAGGGGGVDSSAATEVAAAPVAPSGYVGGKGHVAAPQHAKSSKPARLHSAPARDSSFAAPAALTGGAAVPSTNISSSSVTTASGAPRRQISSASHLRPQVGALASAARVKPAPAQHVDASFVVQDRVPSTSVSHDVDENLPLRETLRLSATGKGCTASGVLRTSGHAEKYAAARMEHLLPTSDQLRGTDPVGGLQVPLVIDTREDSSARRAIGQGEPNDEAPPSDDEDAEFVVRHYSPYEAANVNSRSHENPFTERAAPAPPVVTANSGQTPSAGVAVSVAREPSQLCEPPSVESSRRQHKSQMKSVLSDASRPLPPPMASTTSVASVDQTALFDAEREANTARQLRLSSSVVLTSHVSVDTNRQAAQVGSYSFRGPPEASSSDAVIFRHRHDLDAPSPAAERRYECVSDDDDQCPCTDDRAFFFPPPEGSEAQSTLSPEVVPRRATDCTALPTYDVAPAGPRVLPPDEVNVGVHVPVRTADLQSAAVENRVPSGNVPELFDDLADRRWDRPSSRWLEGVPSPPPPVRMSHELGCSPPEHQLADKSRYEYDPVVGCYFDRVSNRFVKPPGAQPLSLPGSAPCGGGRRPSPTTVGERGCSPGQPFRQRPVL